MLQNQTLSSFSLRAGSGIALVIAVIFFEYVGVMRPLRTTLERLFIPIQSRITQLSYGILQPLFYVEKAYTDGKDIAGLQSQLSYSLARLSDLEGVEKENTALRSLFENSDRTWRESVVAAPVLSFGVAGLAVGEQAGVKPGAVVVAAGTVVGRIGEVTDQQSSVLLLNSVSAPFLLVTTATGVSGIIRGDGQQILFTEVSKSQIVPVGDRIVTKGQEGVPPNLFVGTVRNQTSTEVDSILTFVIDQPVVFYESTVVEVILR